MKTITIQGIEFDANEPYSVGHVLLENEASALNQTFAENLRNNFAKTVADAKDGGELTDAAIEALRDQFDEYAKTYSFGTRRHGEVDPVRLIKNKADTLTDAQKQAIAESLGFEFKPKKTKAA